MTKSDIRQQVLDARRSIEPERRDLLNMLVFERAHKHRVFQRARRVHIYQASPEEVRTMPFIEYAWGIGKEVAVPRISLDRSEMEHVVVTHETEWTDGAFGIMEPARSSTDVLLSDEDFGPTDAVIVPLIAFDRTCHRLGYGKGYYDRFLASTSAVAIGIAYEVQRVISLPHEPHDIALSAIATEERWYAP
ncbi:MAG: 5-formyltetrahydrofolate cyclo-ligase [Ignavibacteriae bacterium]|nr:MAG: 5-formyltetrahydrofolate cyclo-ligase [Ignavibacteriota bacterium]